LRNVFAVIELMHMIRKGQLADEKEKSFSNNSRRWQLHKKAKAEVCYHFYAMCDQQYWEDIPAMLIAQCRSKKALGFSDSNLKISRIGKTAFTDIKK
jgi:hypothetical protein